MPGGYAGFTLCFRDSDESGFVACITVLLSLALSVLFLPGVNVCVSGLGRVRSLVCVVPVVTSQSLVNNHLVAVDYRLHSTSSERREQWDERRNKDFPHPGVESPWPEEGSHAAGGTAVGVHLRHLVKYVETSGATSHH